MSDNSLPFLRVPRSIRSMTWEAMWQDACAAEARFAHHPNTSRDSEHGGNVESYLFCQYVDWQRNIFRLERMQGKVETMKTPIAVRIWRHSHLHTLRVFIHMQSARSEAANFYIYPSFDVLWLNNVTDDVEYQQELERHHGEPPSKIGRIVLSKAEWILAAVNPNYHHNLAGVQAV